LIGKGDNKKRRRRLIGLRRKKRKRLCKKGLRNLKS